MKSTIGEMLFQRFCCVHNFNTAHHSHSFTGKHFSSTSSVKNITTTHIHNASMEICFMIKMAYTARDIHVHSTFLYKWAWLIELILIVKWENWVKHFFKNYRFKNCEKFCWLSTFFTVLSYIFLAKIFSNFSTWL